MKKRKQTTAAIVMALVISSASFATGELDKNTTIPSGSSTVVVEKPVAVEKTTVTADTIFDIETKSGTQQVAARVYKEEAEKLVKLVNEARAKAGLKAYKVEEKFLNAAQLRAVELSLNFSHNRPNGTLALTATKGLNGENIAKNQQTAEELMEAFMGSPGHKKNIMHTKFKKINVGCVEVDGNIYWVQLFGV